MATTSLQSVPGSSKPVFINPPGLYDPAPNGYSHPRVIGTPASLVFAAGQGGEKEKGELSSLFEAQLKQAFRNVQTSLSAANADMSDVVKLTVLVVNHTQAHLDTYIKVIKSIVGNGPAPAFTLIPVPFLALDGMLVEIKIIAAVRL